MNVREVEWSLRKFKIKGKTKFDKIGFTAVIIHFNTVFWFNTLAPSRVVCTSVSVCSRDRREEKQQ